MMQQRTFTHTQTNPEFTALFKHISHDWEHKAQALQKRRWEHLRDASK